MLLALTSQRSAAFRSDPREDGTTGVGIAGPPIDISAAAARRAEIFPRTSFSDAAGQLYATKKYLSATAELSPTQTLMAFVRLMQIWAS